jgi:hypothetical protein
MGVDFTNDKRETAILVAEHIALETLTHQSCLPLDFATDNWVTARVLSAAICNEGSRKAALNPTASYFIIFFIRLIKYK